jgi:cytochrome c oxidase subunit 3
MKKDKVVFTCFLTIIGGGIFVGSQAWEWKNFIKGEYGAIETKGGSLLSLLIKGKRVALAELLLLYQR